MKISWKILYFLKIGKINVLFFCSSPHRKNYRDDSIRTISWVPQSQFVLKVIFHPSTIREFNFRNENNNGFKLIKNLECKDMKQKKFKVEVSAEDQLKMSTWRTLHGFWHTSIPLLINRPLSSLKWFYLEHEPSW